MLRARPPKQLAVRSTSSSWSALEVLSHLVKVDQGMLHDVQKNIFEPPVRVGSRARLRGTAIALLMWTPARVSVPSSQANRILPDAGPGFTMLCEQWKSAREAFHAIDYTAIAPDTRAFYHAVGGWYTVSGTLSLLLAHTHHHRYQLKRIFARLA